MAVTERERRGISNLISFTLLIGIVIGGIILTLSSIRPTLEQQKDVAAINRAQKTLLSIDGTIRNIADGVQGTSLTHPLRVRKGTYDLEPANDSIQYTVASQVEIVSPGTATEIGGLWLSATNTTTTATINYTDIDLRGSTRTLEQGLYELVFTHKGIENGSTVIEVTVE